MTRPACLGHDPELWFSLDLDEQQRAMDICAGCPLRAACLEGARARREPWGVWGGEWLGAPDTDDVMVVAEARIRVAIAACPGSRARYVAGCRCLKCREQNRLYKAKYDKDGPVTPRPKVVDMNVSMFEGAAV